MGVTNVMSNSSSCLSPFSRHPGPITVSTDGASGFVSLEKGDKQLEELDITLVTKDEFNVNFNAVVDRQCQELEAELRKLAPESAAVTQAQLSKAVLQLNAKLRRKGSLAAYEIHAARSLHTGTNIKLQDNILRKAQLESRKERQPDLATKVDPC